MLDTLTAAECVEVTVGDFSGCRRTVAVCLACCSVVA